jgi:hypothetical protein
MATRGAVQATASGPQAARDSKGLGPQAIADEIRRLSNVGLYAIPVRMFWNEKKGTKDADFPPKYAHITTSWLWEQSINDAMRQRMDANGVAILTGPSQLIVIDVDVFSKGTKKPGIELWNRLVDEHGEPTTLQAKTWSGGKHFFFKARTPGLKCTRNFSGIKVDTSVYGIDGRARGGVVFAHPASYVKDQGKLATYEWLNGPSSFEACQDVPPWLTSFLNDHVQQTAADEIDTNNFVKRPKEYGSRESDSIATPSAMDNATSMPLAPLENVQNTVALPGLERALEKIKNMLHAKVPNDASTFNGVGERTPNGWQVLKFKTNGIRTCLNGHQHVSNNFSNLSNGGVFAYRCLSSECIDRPKPLLGAYFWPECLPLRAEGELFKTCESYILPFEPSTDESDEKREKNDDDIRTRKAKLDLLDLALRIMNHYFAVVRSTKAVYLETISSRDANGRLEPEETIHRSGRDFLEVCRNFQLQSLPGKSKEVAKFWESSFRRREFRSCSSRTRQRGPHDISICSPG